MKIKTKKVSYEKIGTLKKLKHKRPKKPNIFFRTLIRVLSIPELMATRFKMSGEFKKRAGKGPYFILMNHSAFIDLKIAYKIFYPMPFCTVATTDAFVGKGWLMRQIGCIPTNKFVTDLRLVTDMLYTVNTLKTSLLMYPEAGYSFDGTATALPRGLGKLIKKMNLPVITVITDGAFHYQPLYNGLLKRKVKVSAKVDCLLTKDEIENKTTQEIDEMLDKVFLFDNFASQKNNNVRITEPKRAEGLERIIYKCAACNAENAMKSDGTRLTCSACGKSYEMTELGEMRSLNGETEFSHIPDWYKWERKCVLDEIENGEYKLDTKVEIALLTDYKCLYFVGEGRLLHTLDGFKLTGCDGKLEYTHPYNASYGLNADYFWYEIGDVICIGDRQCLYYCFPKGECNVTKARLAAEEIYKLKSKNAFSKIKA